MRTPKPLCDPSAIVNALQAILAPGQVTELRALEATLPGDRRPVTVSGYFDDPAKLAKSVATLKGAKGVYFIPNPIKPELLARAANRIKVSGKGDATQDTDILKRRWLPIDLDAVRPSGISSSDVEHDAAITRAREVYGYLRNLGWPDPIAADSGNGAHLLYRVDLPADAGGLIQRCLTALGKRFDDMAVHVDRSVFNPARIWKLYGTLACKGDDTPERPHRMAKILKIPEELSAMPIKLLESLAAEVAAEGSPQTHPTKYHGNGEPFDIEAFIRRHALEVDDPETWNGEQGQGRRWVFRTSPMCEHHDDGPHLLQHASGAITAGCQHNSCSWTWHDLRQKLEPVAEKRRIMTTAKSELRGHQTIDVADVDTEELPEPIPWPELHLDAYQGVAGCIVRAIEPETEADPVAILIQFLVAIGNIFGRSAYFVVEGTHHYPNLFAVLVGKTARGRKGTSEGRARQVLRLIDERWADENIKTGLVSGEGLIWSVRDPIYKTESIKEKGRIVGSEQVLADAGIEDKRLLVIENEFASALRVCKRETNTLSPTLRSAWDSGQLRTMAKNSPAKATDAHISIIGHITQEELRAALTMVDGFNGFANRFLWAVVRRSKLLPDGGRDLDLSAYAQRLAYAADRVHVRGRMDRDQGAAALWRNVYAELADDSATGFLAAVTSRAEAQVLRISMIYALMDASTIIREEHHRAAMAVWRYCRESARLIFGRFSGDPLADRILELVQKQPGIGRKEIHRATGNHIKGEILVDVLAKLRDAKKIRAEIITSPGGGRPAESWYPCEKSERCEQTPDKMELRNPQGGISSLNSQCSQSLAAMESVNAHLAEVAAEESDDWGEV